MSRIHMQDVISVEWNPYRDRYEIVFGYGDSTVVSATYLTSTLINDHETFPALFKSFLERIIKQAREGNETPSNT